MKDEKCEYCEGVIEETVTRVPFRYNDEAIYVDNVPVGVTADAEKSTTRLNLQEARDGGGEKTSFT